MAASPIFFATPTVTASVISATAYGGTRTAPTGTTTIYTGSTTVAHQIRRITVKSLLTSVLGYVDFWLYDGTTYYHLPNSILIEGKAGSTTVDPWFSRVVFGEGNNSMILPARAGTAWTIVAGASVTQTTAIACVVHGAVE